MPNLIPVEIIEQRIFLIRGEKVMLDRHLAELYAVDTRTLNQSVKRNTDRFPANFMFQLSEKERDEVITICDNLLPLKFARTLPYAFTEQGVAMLSGVLRSKRAVQVNIQIMNTFVLLRRMLADNKALAHRLNEMEKKYDAQFKVVFDALRKLITPPDPPKRPIGFRVGEGKTPYIVIKRKS